MEAVRKVTRARWFNLISNRYIKFRCLHEQIPQTKYSDEKETHFGYETVTEEEKAKKVYDVFENVASKYDLMNDVMSMGIHRLWKDYFVHCLAPTSHTQLIDVAGGTGDIALRYLNYIKNLECEDRTTSDSFDIRNPIVNEDNTEADRNTVENHLGHVLVCDINQAMLKVGKEYAKTQGYVKGISWIQGDAEDLPVADNSFDAYTIAFGIRNVVHIEKALSEAYRVLRPGGRFMCLEFSEVSNSAIRWFYDTYSFQVIPVLGQVIAKDWKSYQYLVESIRNFPNQEQFKVMIRNAGFNFVTFENLSCGIAAIHSGFKL